MFIDPNALLILCLLAVVVPAILIDASDASGGEQ